MLLCVPACVACDVSATAQPRHDTYLHRPSLLLEAALLACISTCSSCHRTHTYIDTRHTPLRLSVNPIATPHVPFRPLLTHLSTSARPSLSVPVSCARFPRLATRAILFLPPIRASLDVCQDLLLDLSLADPAAPRLPRLAGFSSQTLPPTTLRPIFGETSQAVRQTNPLQ